MYEIKSNVPVPSRVAAARRKSRYGFENLRPGDHFVVPFKDAKPESVRSATQAWGRRHAVQLVTRIVADGTGVWRVPTPEAPSE